MLGINIVQRLVVPRVVAAMIVGTLVTGLVMGVGIAGGYFFNVVLQHGTSGVYVQSFKSLASVGDIGVSLFKGLLFGGVAAVVGLVQGAPGQGRSQGCRPGGQRVRGR